MSPSARNQCEFAVQEIHAGNYEAAILFLRTALKNTPNRRAWSKLMLAIRELSRVA